MSGSTDVLLFQENDAITASAALTGRKAQGLLALPSAWVPPFFVLTTSLHERWKLAGCTKRLELQGNETRLLREATLRLKRDGARRLLVRSSAEVEALQARGQFLSLEAGLSTGSVLKAAVKLYDHAKSVVGERTRVGVVVQTLVEPMVAGGHLSNERRLSPDPEAWFCEIESGSVGSVAGVVAVDAARRRTAHRMASDSLNCRDPGELHSRWSDVSGWALSLDRRIHFEWLWDGNRLWVVQGDPDERRPDEGPRISRIHARRPRLTTDLETVSLKAMVRAQDLPPGLSAKADWLAAFERQGLATGRLWAFHLPVERCRSLEKGEGPAELLEDLALLTQEPIVIRTDVPAPAQDKQSQSQLFLPHSETVETVERALRFVTDVCRQLLESGLDHGVVFLIHHFVPCLAAALCHANPDTDTSLIESTFGLPDSLQHCSHDSFQVGNSGSKILSRRIRFKDAILDVTESGSWSIRPLGEPWDWRPSLSDNEVLNIASGSFAVAASAGRPLQIMWFAGVQDPAYPSCLPWQVLPADGEFQPSGSMPSVVHLDLATRLRIESEDDQARVLEHLENSSPSSAAIELRPRSELLRSTEFLQTTAEIATKFSVPIVLYGSVLSHAYYILRRCGVVVLSPEDAKTGRAE